MWAANGSNEIIQQLLQAFGGPGRSALGFEPSYSMHPLIARPPAPGGSPRDRDEDFGLDPEPGGARHPRRAAGPGLPHLAEQPDRHRAPLAVIEAVCEAAPGMVVVDEAYAEFARDGTPSALTLLPRFPRLVVTRTMSKAFALAGARVGYLAADPEVVEALLLVRLPYHLSAVTQAVARAALAQPPSRWPPSPALRAERDELVGWLRARGLRVADSDANFVLFGTFADRRDVWQGAAGPRRADPGDRARRAGCGSRVGTPRGDGRVPRRADGGAGSEVRRGQADDRAARVERVTKETQLLVELDLDGTGVTEVEHRRAVLRPHARPAGQARLLDLTVQAKGDIEIDAHHTVEDTAIALGQALREALGDKAGICRFGDALVPLDETLARAAVDLSGRPYVVHAEPAGMAPLIGSYDTTLTRHFFESLASSARDLPAPGRDRGRNPHHIVEAQFKAVARALRAAAAPDPRAAGSRAPRACCD